MKTRIWLGVGSFVVAGALSIPQTGATPFGPSGPKMPRPPLTRTAAEAGEAGENGDGGEGGGMPETYAIGSTDPNAFAYDASAEIVGYVGLVHDSYRNAADAAVQMEAAIAALLEQPGEETLSAARQAWIAARPAYLVTEAFRFYDGPIETLEGRLNAWPLNEAYIDYVEGDPKAGLINSSAPLDLSSINSVDQRDDEADVTTGWHAIEFLLWGQDLSADGPGARPVTDFAPGTASGDRRREYLRIVTRQLVSDLEALAAVWSPDGIYPRTFLALPQREAIGRMLNGAAILAAYEFMSERLTVALDSGDQEDEHSCFSDTTKQDFVFDLAGVKGVWTGIAAGVERPGLAGLVRRIDAATADRVDALLADAEAKVAALGDPWDRVLASPAGSPERSVAEEAATALQALGDGFEAAGQKLGVVVLIPGAG